MHVEKLGCGGWKVPPPPPPSLDSQLPARMTDFIMEFSPDEAFVA